MYWKLKSGWCNPALGDPGHGQGTQLSQGEAEDHTQRRQAQQHSPRQGNQYVNICKHMRKKE